MCTRNRRNEVRLIATGLDADWITAATCGRVRPSWSEIGVSDHQDADGRISVCGTYRATCVLAPAVRAAVSIEGSVVTMTYTGNCATAQAMRVSCRRCVAPVVARLADVVGAGVAAEAASAVARDEEHRAGRPGAALYPTGVLAAEEQDAARGDGGEEHVMDLALVVQLPRRGAVDVEREVTGGAARLLMEQLGGICPRRAAMAVDGLGEEQAGGVADAPYGRCNLRREGSGDYEVGGGRRVCEPGRDVLGSGEEVPVFVASAVVAVGQLYGKRLSEQG